MDKKAMIPYFVHEGEMVRMERIIKRLWVTVILLIILLVGTNGAWLLYESQFEYFEETTTVEQSAEGDGDIIMNGTGEVNVNGERKADDNDNN